MFHTVAYQFLSGAATATDQDMALVSDPSVTNLNSHPIFPVPTWIQWAWIGGATVIRGRITAPRLRPVTRPVLNPTDTPTPSSPSPMITQWWRHPIQLNPVEEIQILTTKTSAVAEQDVAILTVGDNVRTVPQGDMYVLRMTSTNATTAVTWNPAANTPDDTLQVGRYSIIGLRIVNAGAVAGRLIFPGAPIVGGLPQIRPGALAAQNDSTVAVEWWRYGLQGEYGQFESFALPQTEVVGGAAVAATTESFFDIVDVRVGARAQ